MVNNTGNIEGAYTAVITGMSGPVTAHLVGLDGQPTQTISRFVLPGLSFGTFLLHADLAAMGQGTVTVQVRSLSDAAMTATATATVSAGAVAVSTSTQLLATPNPATLGLPVTFTAIVTTAGGGIASGTVTFTIDGTPLPPVALAASNGQARATLTIAAPGVGNHTITASYLGGPGFVASVSSPVVLAVGVTPVASGPIITSVRRFGVHMHPTRLVLRFDQDLDPAGATNLANYRLIGPGRDGRLGTRDDRVIRLRKATYDPVTRSVKLRPKLRLPLRDRFRLMVFDTKMPAMVNRTGIRLDGDRDGSPGGMAVLPIRRANLVLPARFGVFRRGGKAARTVQRRHEHSVVRSSPTLSKHAVDAVLDSGLWLGRGSR